MPGHLQLPTPLALPPWLFPQASQAPPPPLPPGPLRRLPEDQAAAAYPAPLYSPKVSGLGLRGDDVMTRYDVAEELNGIPETLQVKNTFIEVNGGLDLKSMLQEGRQIRSCPGSRLTSPRGMGDVGRPTESSQASTADTGEAERLQRDSPGNFPELLEPPGTFLWGQSAGAARAVLAQQAQAERAARSALAQQAQRAQAERLHFDSLRALERPASTFLADQRAAAYAVSNAAAQQAQVLLLAHALAFDAAAARIAMPKDSAAAAPVPTVVDKGHRGRGQLMLGSAAVPSVGSLGHATHRCKPCAFFARSGCANGVQCGFCHLCDVGEKKRRRKEKRSLVAAARKMTSTSMSAEA